MFGFLLSLFIDNSILNVIIFPLYKMKEKVGGFNYMKSCVLNGCFLKYYIYLILKECDIPSQNESKGKKISPMYVCPLYNSYS